MMSDQPRRNSTTWGFARTSRLIEGRVRRASESRGFAESRLLTHWAEIVGEDFARLCRPVSVSYAKGGMGATLTVLTAGPQAPVLEMQKAQLQERVNGCYGYRAIARVRITQTAPEGFAEAQAEFRPAAKSQAARAPDPRASTLTEGVGDTELRLALEALADNVLRKPRA